MTIQQSRLVRAGGVALALAAVVACGEKEPNTPASMTEPLAAPLPPPSPAPQSGAQARPSEPTVFTMAPASGTRFMRTELRHWETSLVGTPLARRQDQELRWQVDVGKSGDQFVISQELRHVTMKHNDATLIDAEVPAGAIAAQLVVDRAGTLKEVRGLEKTSETLKSLANAGAKMDEVDEMALSPAALKSLVAMRYEVLAGDIAGRPVAQGSTWTIAARPGSPIISRILTVEGMESCDGAQCARIREDVKLDPVAVRDIASDLIKRRVKELGGDPKKVQNQSTTYSMAGSLLIEPATMLHHDAALAESGRVVAATAKESFEVAISGSTRFSYDYGAKPVAQASKR
jgi:hypothetical protein